MISHLTFSSMRASVIPQARIYTLHINTSVFARAITIAIAADYSTTTNSSVTITSFSTATFGCMIDHVAFGMWSTVVSQQTWIHTIVVYAWLVGTAFTVTFTFHAVTCHLGITLVAWFARTDCTMIFHQTNGVGTTTAWLATETIDTWLVVGTFVVRDAYTSSFDWYCVEKKKKNLVLRMCLQARCSFYCSN